MRHPKLRTLAAVMLPVVLLLALSSVASAQWIVNNPPDSWDDKPAANGGQKWQNSNIVMNLNNDPQPFLYSFGVGAGGDEFDTVSVADACGAGTSTVWAGNVLIGLGHTDTNGGMGFQSTKLGDVPRGWNLVSCNALLPKSGAQKKYPAAGDIKWACTADNADGKIDRCEILPTQDDIVSTDCGGNCQDEIQTRIQVNLDLNCDGQLDSGFDSDVCLYWEAKKPPLNTTWTTPLQVRIQDDQGDKTLTFNELRGPNAIGLQSFGASAKAAGVNPLAVVLGVALVGLSGLALAWRSARG